MLMMNRLLHNFWKIWTWPKAAWKLARIREISSKYYNDSKFTTITNIIDE